VITELSKVFIDDVPAFVTNHNGEVDSNKQASDPKPIFPNLSMNSSQNYLGSFPDMLSYQLRHNSKHTLEG
jgi:hypothetical protein